MAVTWTVEMTIADEKEKKALVTGTRTDGADIRTFTITENINPNQPANEQKRIVKALKKAYEDDVDRRKKVLDVAVKTWPAAIAAELNA